MRYADLAAVYDKLFSTTKRLEKITIVAAFLKTVPAAEIKTVVPLLRGKVFPDYDERHIGVADKLVIKAILQATGTTEEKLAALWKETGDLGETAARLVTTKKQATLFSQQLTTHKVFTNIHKLATTIGSGSVDQKTALIAELLTSATPTEARYVVRTVLEDLRVGLGDGTMRDAIMQAYLCEELGIVYNADKNDLGLDDEKRKQYDELLAVVQEAYDVQTDWTVVATIAAEKGVDGLRNVELTPGRPVKVMLYQKAANITAAFDTVGKPAAFEYKYDGFRMQIHKTGGVIRIYTRNLEEVTTQFPDVVALVKSNVTGDDFILDAEAIGWNMTTQRFVPFQEISQRIKRKHGIAAMANELPVIVVLFDLLAYDGRSFLRTTYTERRAQLARIVTHKDGISLSEQIVTDDETAAQRFYHTSLGKGNEGIMAKKLDGLYQPGARVGSGVKIKPVMETLDVVIVGAEWGEGKRGKWLASFTVAVQDQGTGELVEIGHVGTGIKEKAEEGVSFAQLTEMLLPHVISEDGRAVKVTPTLVIEVAYEEVQASPTYSSGYALRFPRFVRLRADRGLMDISTTEDVERLYSGQRGRNGRAGI